MLKIQRYKNKTTNPPRTKHKIYAQKTKTIQIKNNLEKSRCTKLGERTTKRKVYAEKTMRRQNSKQSQN